MEYKCHGCGTTNPKHFEDWDDVLCVKCEELHEAECEADALWGEDPTEEIGS